MNQTPNYQLVITFLKYLGIVILAMIAVTVQAKEMPQHHNHEKVQPDKGIHPSYRHGDYRYRWERYDSGRYDSGRYGWRQPSPPPAAPPHPAYRAPVYWVPAHNIWRGGVWVTVPGFYTSYYVGPIPAPYYEPEPRWTYPGWIWVRGHWRWGGIQWIWTPGTWERI